MKGTDPRRHWSFLWRLGLARCAHAFERIWPAVWPTLAVVGLFLVVSLFGLWPYLPTWLHGLGLLGFAVALGCALFRARAALTWPSRDAALGRLERVNALPHRPLRSLGDGLSGGQDDQVTRSLWQRHQQRLARMVDGLKVGLPRSDLPSQDRWALRVALALLLIVALVEAGSMAPKRLAQAFELKRAGGAVQIPVQLAVWITPPDYTDQPPYALDVTAPVALSETVSIGIPQGVDVPAGSELLAQVHHADDAVEQYGVTIGDVTEPFTAAGRGSAEAHLILEQSGRLTIGSPREALGVWDVEIIPDQPPEIAFAEPPAATHRNVMRFGFEAVDDYGVASIVLVMNRPGQEEEAERIELIQPARGAVDIDDAAYLDLTPHPWSGLAVEMRLEATDGIEQSGLSDVETLVLPTRSFSHPVARAIVELRRRLAENTDRRAEVAAALNGLSHMPERFQNDSTVFMALRSAATRLVFEEELETVDAVMELMWETALHLEDGNMSLASRELRDLQEALRDALANGASDAELERLMSELRRALDNYLDALAQQAEEQAGDQTLAPMDANAMTVQRQDLEQMLDSLRDMIQTGAREAAQEMLAQLQELLENLQVGQQTDQARQGQQMMNDLQELIQRQQELLDQTYGLSRQQSLENMTGQQEGQRGQQGQQGQQGQMGDMRPGGQRPGQGSQAAMDQESLRRALGELMRSLGDNGIQIPRAMGEAELSMRAARDALEGGRPGEALDPQAEALDELRQGGQAMMQELQRMIGQNGQGQQMPGQQFGQQGPADRDPLGRSMFNRGSADLNGPHVPTDLDLGKARAIMEELRRRAGQRYRPAEELDYLERLLRRF